jgi:DNA end-binding protein Ku
MKAKSAELNMAVKLIDQLTEKFDISKYKDTYTDKLLKIIRAKAHGKLKARPKLKVVHKQTSDIMEALKASLGKKKKAS